METVQIIRHQNNWSQRLEFEATGLNYDDFIDRSMQSDAILQHFKKTRHLSIEEATEAYKAEHSLKITEIDYKDINDSGEFEVVERTFKIIG